MTGPTVLFRTHDGAAPGFPVQGLDLAREILDLVPDARVIVHARRAAAATSCPSSVRWVIEAGPGTGWRDVLSTTLPDLAVYDTVVPDDPAHEPLARHTRVATVLRRTHPERHARILAGGFLDRSDAIVVPHTRQEFGLPLPEAVQRRTCFAGTITRRPDPGQHEGLRDRYGLRPDHALLVSTAAGGEPGHDAGPFLAAAGAVQAALTRVPRPVQHVVVLGPHHRGPVPEIPGALVVGVEPCLVDLLDLADLALVEGGDTSVSELRVAGTPAVFLSGDRSPGDRSERVRALAEQGVARVVPDAAPATAADVVTDLLAAPGRLEEMRRRARALPVPLGNRAAAEHLLGPLLRRGAA